MPDLYGDRTARSHRGLGDFFGFLPLGRQDLNRAACLLDRGHGRFGGAPDRKGDFCLDLADAEQPDPVPGSPQHAGLDQRNRIDRAAGIELAGIDRRLHALKVDLVELFGERRVLEAALGQAPVQRHLAALETLDPHARARGLALAAAAAGLAGTRADAAPDAGAALARPRPVGELIELHRSSPVTLDRPRARGDAPSRSCRGSPVYRAIPPRGRSD